MSHVLFPGVLVLGYGPPQQSPGGAPTIEDVTRVDRLTSSGHNDHIMFEMGVVIRLRPVQLQCLERQLSELRSDAMCPMKTEPAITRTDMNEEVLDESERKYAPFLLQTPRRLVSGLGNHLRLHWVDVG